MKLSKKNAAVQRAIQKAIASGKALGGLLVGIAATVSGCREGNSPESTMGSYPAPHQQENVMNENRNQGELLGDVAPPAKTNVVNERKNRKANRFMGKTPRSSED